MSRSFDGLTIYAAGGVQGLALVTFPALGSILTSKSQYGLSTSAFGALFVPLAITSILAALLGAGATKRLGVKPLCQIGLAANTLSMAALLLSALVMTQPTPAHLLLLTATGLMGVGFGLTVPALNTYAAELFPQSIDVAVLAMNAVLGLGTALAPLLIILCAGAAVWWGLPLGVVILLLVLLAVSAWLRPPGAPPRQIGAPASAAAAPAATRTALFWSFGVFALLYGACETMNSTWTTPYMTQQLGASATMASIALAAFWGMVTIGRIIFFALERWLPERVVFPSISMIVVGTFLFQSLIPSHHPWLGLLAFAAAGLGCSGLLPLAISFSQKRFPALQESIAGGVIACYQLGYGLAAFGVGPLHERVGLDLSTIYALCIGLAIPMALLAFLLAPATAAPAPAPQP